MELSSYGDHELECMSDFAVSITLTKKGLANVDKVVDAVFKYIQRLKEIGPQEWIFNETNQIGKITFDFQEKSDPFDYIVEIAEKMPLFATPQDLTQILRSKYISDEYDPELLTQIGEILADPESCLVIVSSKSIDEATLPKHEKWYNYNYSVEKMTEARIAELKAAQAPENGKALDLPPQNNLIATNFDILPEDQSLSSKPLLIKQIDDVADVWYRKDDRFKKPKGIVAVKIYTTDCGFGVSQNAQVFAEVWKGVLEESLRELVYLAECAKLKFEIRVGRDNIEMKWRGYNSSLTNFVDEIMQRISAFKSAQSQDIFEQVKEKLSQEWKNYYLNQVYRLARAEIDTFLHEHDDGKKRLAEILETFTYE